VLVSYTCGAKGERKALGMVEEEGCVVLAFDFVVAVVVVGVVVGNDDCDDKGQKENGNGKSVGSCHMLTQKDCKRDEQSKNEENESRASQPTYLPFLEGHPPWEFYQPIP
jgi:hypothetical protein